MNFLDMVELVAMGNCIPMKPRGDIDTGSLDVAMLDNQAARLSEDEAEMFCCGELTEAEEITERHGVHELHHTLDRIFDGDLHWNFYIDDRPAHLRYGA